MRDGDVRRLVLDDHLRRGSFAVVEHAVAAAAHTAHADGDFLGEQRGGVVLVVREPMGEVLAYLLFGSEQQKTAAQEVVDLRLALFVDDPEVAGGELEWLHGLGK